MAPPPLARTERSWAAYGLAIAGSAVATVAAQMARHWLGVSDLSLVFMLAVLLVALRTRAGPAALTAVLCFLAYNFFFIEPRYTLYISARHGVATVLLFLAAALLAGRLASRLAEKADALAEAQRHMAARQALGQDLAMATQASEVTDAAQRGFRAALDAETWLRLAPDTPNATPAAMHESVEEHGWWQLPLRAGDRTLGVLGLKLPEGLPRLGPRERAAARGMADDIAQALLRTRLAGELERQRVATEAERLRSGLLASVSHDLRTPLASIIGASETLEEWGPSLPEDDRRALAATVREEGMRLDRYLQNLLDMMRLSQGVALVRARHDLPDLIGTAIQRVKRHRPAARIEVELPATLPPVHVQHALIEQAFYNVIDNALKFSGDASPVHVRVDVGLTAVTAFVRDHGPGVAAGDRERVFDMFHRVERRDRGPSGTGLGLSIARAILDAHGGSIAFEPCDDGACVRMLLPIGDAR